MSIKTVGELINELQKFDENQEVELFSVTRNFAVNDYSGSYITRVEARDEIVNIFNEDFPIYRPFRDAEECFTEMLLCISHLRKLPSNSLTTFARGICVVGHMLMRYCHQKIYFLRKIIKFTNKRL